MPRLGSRGARHDAIEEAGDLVEYVNEVSDGAIDLLCEEYESEYAVVPELRARGLLPAG